MRVVSACVLLFAVLAFGTACTPTHSQTVDIYSMSPPGGRYGTTEGWDKWCNDRWNALWPRAMEGDEEARFLLYTWVAGFMHSSRLVLPGSSDDRATRNRDMTILAVYAWDYMVALPEDHPYVAFITLYRNEIAVDLLRTLTAAGGTYGFTDCVNNLSGNCAQKAVKGRLVPSFETFAEGINMSIKAGNGPSCHKV